MRPPSLVLLLTAALLLPASAEAVPIEIEMVAFVGEGLGSLGLQRGDRLEIAYTIESDALIDPDLPFPPDPTTVFYADAVLSLSAYAPERDVTLAGLPGDFMVSDERVLPSGGTRDLVNLIPIQPVLGGFILAFADDGSGTMLDSLALPTTPLVYEYGYALNYEGGSVGFQYELFPTRALALPEPGAGLLLAACAIAAVRRLR